MNTHVIHNDEKDYLTVIMLDMLARRSNVFQFYRHFGFDFNGYMTTDWEDIFSAEFLSCQGFLRRILSCVNMGEYVVVALFIQEFLSGADRLWILDFLASQDSDISISALSKLFFSPGEMNRCTTVHDLYDKVLSRAFDRCFVGDLKLFKKKVSSSRKPLKYFFLNPTSYDMFKSLYYSDAEVSYYKLIIHRYANESIAVSIH